MAKAHNTRVIGSWLGGFAAGLRAIASVWPSSPPMRYPHASSMAALRGDVARIGADMQRVVHRAAPHRLVGYDPATEFIAFEKDVPAHKLDMVKRIAHVASDDPDAVYCYELAPLEARDIANVSGFALPSEKLAFFLEPGAA